MDAPEEMQSTQKIDASGLDLVMGLPDEKSITIAIMLTLKSADHRKLLVGHLDHIIARPILSGTYSVIFEDGIPAAFVAFGYSKEPLRSQEVTLSWLQCLDGSKETGYPCIVDVISPTVDPKLVVALVKDRVFANQPLFVPIYSPGAASGVLVEL